MATHSSCLGNPIDRGAWRATVHEVTKSQSQLSDLNFHFHTFYYIICWEENKITCITCEMENRKMCLYIVLASAVYIL